MLSANSPRSRSPSESTVTESVRSGPATNLNSQKSYQSSITEEDEDESVHQIPPPAPPLPSAFGKSKSSSRSSGSSSTRSESTAKPNANNTTGFRRPTPRRDSSNTESSTSKKKSNPANKNSTTKNAIQKLVIRGIGEQLKGNNKTSTNTKLSTFEKVDRHSGNATYLGTGTYSQLEGCIRNCLSKSGCHNDFHHLSTSTHSTHKSLTRASVLEDYSYEGITAPREQINISTDKFLHHNHFSHDYHSSHHTKHAADLPLEEIRQVNDALAKYGIPVFSYVDQSNNLYNQPRPVGQILSACQQLLADPLLRSQQSNAVQHVWDNISNHSPQTYMHGYASPAVKGVASHLFGNPNQPPYNPVQSVVSNLFSTPPQNQYYQPPPPPPPSFPSYSAPSYPPPPPPPPPSGSGGGAGQSVLSRLFSR